MNHAVPDAHYCYDCEHFEAGVIYAEPQNCPYCGQPMRRYYSEAPSEQVERDAARYRWLRHGDNDSIALGVTPFGEP